MTLFRTLATLSVCAVCAVVVALPAATAVAAVGWQWPLDPTPPVVAAFDPPTSPWGSGHRGVDLAGAAGTDVTAVGPGVITVAGDVAGRGVVVVDHGALRSSYEPVLPGVRVGQHVATGQALGALAVASSHCWPQACLHLGVRRGDDYIDPLGLLGPRPVRLKPLAGTEQAVPSNPTADKVSPRQGEPSSARDQDPRRDGVAIGVGIAGALLLAGVVRRQARG